MLSRLLLVLFLTTFVLSSDLPDTEPALAEVIGEGGH